MSLWREIAGLLRACLRPRKALLAATLGTVLAFNAIELAFPKLLQLVVDALRGHPLRMGAMSLDFLATPVGQIALLPAGLILLAAIRWVATYGRAVLETRLGEDALYDLRHRIFATMQNLSFAYHDRTHSGTLVSNVVEDVNYASRFFRYGLTSLIESALYIVMTCALMTAICPAAGLWSAGLLATALIGVWAYFKWGRHVYAETKRRFAEMVRFFSENIEGHLIARAFGAQSRQCAAYNRKTQAYHRSYFRETSLSVAMTQGLVWAMYLGIPAVLGAAIHAGRVSGMPLTEGELFQLFFLQSSLQHRVRMLGRGMNLLMWFGITAERLGALFREQDYLADGGARRLPETGPVDVSVRDATFAYPGGGRPALRDVSLDIPAGSVVGFAGATGSGKTTLALLLCRFYDPDAGRVLLAGRDAREYALAELRREFSLVFQETFLFSTSIRENIAYGRPDAPYEDIVRAATLAQAHDFIMAFENGYATEVGERGVTLSGGQRQRIGIARAILRRPRFLVLDACTSALDPLTEKAIQDGLAPLRETSTVIVIAQRYSSVAKADKVFVLEDGALVEEGAPAELNVPGRVFHRLLGADPRTRHEPTREDRP